MTWSSYTDFCIQCSIPDNENCQLKTIDTTFIASNVVQGKKNPLNPDRAFVRYQLLEAVVRLALAKFDRPGVQPAHCIRRLMEEHVVPTCEPYFKAFAPFREDVLWTEEVRVDGRRRSCCLSALACHLAPLHTGPRTASVYPFSLPRLTLCCG